MPALDDRITRAFVAGIRDTGDLIFLQSQQNCPVLTGFLKKSGYHTSVPGGIEIGYRASYAGIVEFGQVPHWEQVQASRVQSHTRVVNDNKVYVSGHNVKPYQRWLKARVGSFYFSKAITAGMVQLGPNIVKRLAIEFS